LKVVKIMANPNKTNRKQAGRKRDSRGRFIGKTSSGKKK